MFNVTGAIVPPLNVFFFVFQLSLLLKNVVSKGKEFFRQSGDLHMWPLWLQGTGNRKFTFLWLFCFDLLFFRSSPLQFIWINSNLSSSLHKFSLFSSFSLLFYAFFYCHLLTYRHMDDRVCTSYCIRAVMCVSLTLMATLIWQSSPGYISLSCIKKSWAEKCHTSHLRKTHTPERLLKKSHSYPLLPLHPSIL